MEAIALQCKLQSKLIAALFFILYSRVVLGGECREFDAVLRFELDDLLGGYSRKCSILKQKLSNFANKLRF